MGKVGVERIYEVAYYGKVWKRRIEEAGIIGTGS